MKREIEIIDKANNQVRVCMGLTSSFRYFLYKLFHKKFTDLVFLLLAAWDNNFGPKIVSHTPIYIFFGLNTILNKMIKILTYFNNWQLVNCCEFYVKKNVLLQIVCLERLA